MVAQRGDVALSSASSVLPSVHEAWLPREHPMYRPRHARNLRFTLLCVVIFFSTPLVVLLMGVRPPQIENRALAPFPLPTDGWAMFTGLSPWATDHLPFRDAAITAAGGLSRGIFRESPPFDAGQPEVDRAPNGPIAPPTAAPGSRPPATAGFTKVIEGKDDWLYYGDEILWKCQPFQQLDDVMLQLRRLRQAVEASGRSLVITVAPDKSTAVPEKLPDQYAGQQCASALSRQFWDRVSAETGAIDLQFPLRAEASRIGHQPYFPQDTHWTHEGGLVLTRQLAEAVKPGISNEWRIDPAGTWRGEADLPPLLGQTGELTGRDYRLAPNGVDDRTNRTTSDFRVPLRMTSPPTTGTVSNRVAMLADSYAEFASPFLGAVFNDITILHMDTARRDMALAGGLLRDSEIVMIEVVERHLAPGLSPLSDPVFVDEISRFLAANPRR